MNSVTSTPQHPTTSTPALSAWVPIEGSLSEVVAREPRPFYALAEGMVPAVILRQAFPLDQCRAVVQRLYERGGVVERPGATYDGVGTSLGSLGADPEAFFADAQRTHALYARLFEGLQHPVEFVYRMLSALAPDKRVQVAREDDGRLYGPGIFRIYHSGKGHKPHFDSVRYRENRINYAIYRFRHQFAGVLCLQATGDVNDAGECLLHRQFWTPELQDHLKNGTFHDYAAEHGVEHACISLDAGDFYVFNTLNIHEVPFITGPHPRIVLATFLGFSPDDDAVYVWS